jgi:hypothetical protein
VVHDEGDPIGERRRIGGAAAAAAWHEARARG